ncbi:MAG: hypothetical protein ACI85K_001674 [Hyphomicrobiaceae bacterium]|jgi:hypothetical protein
MASKRTGRAAAHGPAQSHSMRSNAMQRGQTLSVDRSSAISLHAVVAHLRTVDTQGAIARHWDRHLNARARAGYTSALPTSARSRNPTPNALGADQHRDAFAINRDGPASERARWSLGAMHRYGYGYPHERGSNSGKNRSDRCLSRRPNLEGLHLTVRADLHWRDEQQASLNSAHSRLATSH